MIISPRKTESRDSGNTAVRDSSALLKWGPGVRKRPLEVVASEVVLEIRWDPGCGAQMQLAQWIGSMERLWQQPRTGAGSGQKQPQLQSSERTGNAEMSLLLPPPGQITRRKKGFPGREVSYSLV